MKKLKTKIFSTIRLNMGCIKKLFLFDRIRTKIKLVTVYRFIALLYHMILLLLVSMYKYKI